MHKVHTSDAETRKEFKSTLAGRVNTPPTTEPLAPRNKVKVGIPVNFSELGEAHIHQFLLNSELTPEQSREICGFLFADQQTETFELEVVITGKQNKPAESPAPAPEVQQFEIELPHDFSSLKTRDQYIWLSQSGLGLSIPQINDVIDIVAGEAPKSGTGTEYNVSFCQYEMPAVHYVPGKKKKKPNLRPKSKKTEYVLDSEEFKTHIEVELPENFETLSDRNRHGLLVTRFQLFADEATEIIAAYKSSGETEYTVFRPEVTPEPKPVQAEEPALKLELPYGFNTIRPADQYAYLHTFLHLPPAQASDAVAALAGLETKNRFEFSYSQNTEPEANPIEEFITRRNETLSRIATGYEGYTIQADGHIPRIKVTIPETFATLPESERQRYLTTTFRLFPGEASAIISNLRDNPFLSEFIVERPEPRKGKVTAPVKETVIDLELPADFADTSPDRQFAYLKTISKLPPEQAADVVAVLQGQRSRTATFNISYLPPTEKAQGDPVKEFIAQRVLKAEADARRLEMDKRAFELAHKAKPAPKVFEPAPVRTMAVTVPKAITLIDPSQQYLYFTRQLKMLPDEANQLVAAFSGKPTLIEFKVTLED